MVAESQRLLSRSSVGALPSGGPDLFLLTVASLIDEAGDLLLSSVGSANRRCTHTLGTAIEYGARPATGSKLGRRFQYAAAVKNMLVDALRFKPDIILCGVEGPFALAYYLVAKVLRVPFVFLVHVAPSQNTLSGLTKHLNQYVARRAHSVIAHGPYLRDCLLQMGVTPSRLLEFDTSADIPAPLAKDVGASRSPSPLFVFAGRVEFEKGIFDLLTAFHSYRQQKNGQLIYFGEGSACDALREAVNDSPYAQDIDVRGKAPQAEVFGKIANAWATVTPTRQSFPEGRCMTALESLALGTPVIAPDFGPFPYAVNHNVNGLLFNPDDVDALTQSLLNIADTPSIAKNTAKEAMASSNSKQHKTFQDAVMQCMRSC